MEQLQQLMKQRDDLEAEIEAITGSLNSSGTPGMHGGLVDKDGFPISDVEKILSVRELRSLLIKILTNYYGSGKQNDYKELMKQIEEGLYNYHAHLKENPPAADQQPNQNTSQTKSKTTEVEQKLHVPDHIKQKIPFAKVNQVAPMSPAYEAQMLVGDLVIEFGGVDISNNNNLLGIRDLVMKSENKELDVYVKRGDDCQHLILTPKKWSGQGLLGCHLLPHK